MRSYKKLALLAFIATACLTTNVRAQDESIVDTVVEDSVVSDGAAEYVDTTTEAVVDTETVEESTESTKEVEAEAEAEEVVAESVEETPEPVVEEVAVESVTEEGTGLKSKISEITDKLKSKVNKQDAKKIAAFGIGAWGAATGVGWIVDKFGKSAE